MPFVVERVRSSNVSLAPGFGDHPKCPANEFPDKLTIQMSGSIDR